MTDEEPRYQASLKPFFIPVNTNTHCNLGVVRISPLCYCLLSSISLCEHNPPPFLSAMVSPTFINDQTSGKGVFSGHRIPSLKRAMEKNQLPSLSPVATQTIHRGRVCKYLTLCHSHGSVMALRQTERKNAFYMPHGTRRAKQ